MRIFWFVFQNDDSYSCRDIRVTKSGLSVRFRSESLEMTAIYIQKKTSLVSPARNNRYIYIYINICISGLHVIYNSYLYMVCMSCITALDNWYICYV